MLNTHKLRFFAPQVDFIWPWSYLALARLMLMSHNKENGYRLGE